MDVAHLVRVHEAGVAHHVAAVGEVDGEHRAPAVLDGGGAVAVDELVPEGAEVTARGTGARSRGRNSAVDRAQVVEGAVLGAGLAHPELVALLVEGGLDLPEVAVHEVGERRAPRSGSACASRSRSAGRASRSRAGSRAAAGCARRTSAAAPAPSWGSPAARRGSRVFTAWNARQASSPTCCRSASCLLFILPLSCPGLCHYLRRRGRPDACRRHVRAVSTPGTAPRLDPSQPPPERLGHAPAGPGPIEAAGQRGPRPLADRTEPASDASAL